MRYTRIIVTYHFFPYKIIFMDYSVKQKFASSIRWTIVGSVCYEMLKLVHQYFLFKHLPLPMYGLMGTLFSIVFLAIHFSYLVPEHSLTPFLSVISSSKQNFRKLLPWYVLPQLPLLIIGAFVAIFLYARSSLSELPPCFLWVPFCLIIAEGLRMFFRTLLHMIFIHKPTISIELCITIGYFATIWIGHLFLKVPFSMAFIFVPYLVGSVIALCLFSLLLFQFYRSLPLQSHASADDNILNRILKTSSYNYAMSITKNLFTGNFIVALFAQRFGLAEAGLFKFASYIADAMKGILHAVLGFSGSALLASLKQRSLSTKISAFRIINEKINKVIYAILIIMVANFKHLAGGGGGGSLLELALLPAALFLLLTFLGHWSEVYVKFYTLQEQTRTAFFYKAFEAVLVVIVLGFGFVASPTMTMLALAMVKVVCFMLLSNDAYHKWRITPSLFPGWRFIVASTIIAVVLVQFITIISTVRKPSLTIQVSHNR